MEQETWRTKNKLLTDKIDSLVSLRREAREKLKGIGGTPRERSGRAEGRYEKSGPRIGSDRPFGGRVRVLRQATSASARSSATGEADTAEDWKPVRKRERPKVTSVHPPEERSKSGLGGPAGRGRQGNRNEAPRRRAPRSAAVTITGNSDNFSYASALKNAREKVPLRELGIENVRFRVAANGGRVLEIPGEGGARRPIY